MIEVRSISKRYGDRLAVDDLSFTAEPGHVTGFLGPNGAGKSTAMRLIVGLDAPTSGTATVNGKLYRVHVAPLHEVGTMLEARANHTGRSAYNHLKALAETHGIPARRVDEVIDIVGLREVAKKRVGTFSLGMGQRLGIASALLGDPDTLILDEPVNGLDPEGIHWIRTLLRNLADEGRTVFVSSHLMSEMSLMADRLIVVGGGRLIADTSVADFIHQASSDRVRVRTPAPDDLRAALASEPGVAVSAGNDRELLDVQGITAARIGDLAAEGGIALHELTPELASLEEAFMRLTKDAVEYHASSDPASAGDREEVAA
jgi:ABC-2 type transport system ATP-binding protein